MNRSDPVGSILLRQALLQRQPIHAKPSNLFARSNAESETCPHDAGAVDDACQLAHRGGCRALRGWNLPVGRKLRQRDKNERSLAQSRMRHDKVGFLDNPVAIQQQIEIECSGTVPWSTRPAPKRALHSLELRQQLSGAEPGPSDAAGIQKVGLIREANSPRLVDPGYIAIGEAKRQPSRCMA